MDKTQMAKIKYDLTQSEKMQPMTMDLIRAGTGRGASIREFENACFAAIALFQDVLRDSVLGELERDGKTAFERISENLGTILD